jgi:hypothetical protein
LASDTGGAGGAGGAAGGAVREGAEEPGPPGTTVIGVVTGTLPKEGAAGAGTAGVGGGTLARGTAPIWADGAGLGAAACLLVGAAEATTMSRHSASSPQATRSASRVLCLPVL